MDREFISNTLDLVDYLLLFDKIQEKNQEIQALKARNTLLELQYEEQEQYFNIMQDLSQDVLFKIDIESKTLYHRSDCAHIFGIPTVIENFPDNLTQNDIIHPDDLDSYIRYAQQMLLGIGGDYEFRLKLLHGSYEKFKITSRPFKNAKGKAIATIGKLVNIQKIDDLKYQANHDPLTGALNKVAFQKAVTKTLSTACHQGTHALVFLDLDNFKGINDTYGHQCGDYLLSALTKRLTYVLSSKDRIGRIGGDEFMLLLPCFHQENKLRTRVEKILSLFEKEFSFQGQSLQVHTSIGVATFPKNGLCYDELYPKADSALYRSKHLGKNMITFYDDMYT